MLNTRLKSCEWDVGRSRCAFAPSEVIGGFLPAVTRREALCVSIRQQGSCVHPVDINELGSVIFRARLVCGDGRIRKSTCRTCIFVYYKDMEAAKKSIIGTSGEMPQDLPKSFCQNHMDSAAINSTQAGRYRFPDWKISSNFRATVANAATSVGSNSPGESFVTNRTT